MIELISKPFNPEILSFIDGERSITDIKNKVGLTYKSVFLRIKELEKNKIIKFNQSHKPEISKDFEREVFKIINFYKVSKENLQDKMKHPEQKKLILKILNVLNNKRFIERLELLEIFKGEKEFANLKFDLLYTGLMKERSEITKKGKRFLKREQI